VTTVCRLRTTSHLPGERSVSTEDAPASREKNRRRVPTFRRHWIQTVVTGYRPSSLDTDRRRWRKTVVSGRWSVVAGGRPFSLDDAPSPPEKNRRLGIQSIFSGRRTVAAGEKLSSRDNVPSSRDTDRRLSTMVHRRGRQNIFRGRCAVSAGDKPPSPDTNHGSERQIGLGLCPSGERWMTSQ